MIIANLHNPHGSRMPHYFIASVDTVDIALFGIFILAAVLLLFVIFLYGVWLDRRPNSLSPYSRLPLRSASELSYYTSEQVLRFLYDMHEYDNRIFDLRRAALCRETGRIFPDVMTWYGKIKLDWTFLQKRYPGQYVSWGSLTQEQQNSILNSHGSVEGFQLEFSSPNPQPRAIEAKYALTSPGPLYVDLETKILLGWKEVPYTEVEVLVIQKPMNIMTISVT